MRNCLVQTSSVQPEQDQKKKTKCLQVGLRNCPLKNCTVQKPNFNSWHIAFSTALPPVLHCHRYPHLNSCLLYTSRKQHQCWHWYEPSKPCVQLLCSLPCPTK